MKRSVVLAVLVLLCVTLFAGNSLAAEKVKAYTTMEEPLAKALFEQFEKETGIVVEWVRLSSGEAVARIEAEKANPQASIWVGGVGTLHIDAKNKGLTAPYSSRMAGSIPDQFRDPEKFWIGLYVGPIAFCINTDRAKELNLPLPASWADIVKPEYEKKVRVANPGTSGTAYNMVTTLIRVFGNDEDKAFDYLKGLHKNIGQYSRTGTGPIKAVARGETAVSISFVHDAPAEQMSGFPVETATPSEGTGAEIGSISIVKGARNMEAAKKFYEWALTPAAQEMGAAARQFQLPSNKHAKVDPRVPDFKSIKFINYDYAKYGTSAERRRLIARWEKEVNSLPR